LINILLLQDNCFSTGIPDEVKGLRPVVWRILLNHLPPETMKWDDILETQLEIYESWKQELIIKPTIKYEEEKKQANSSKVVFDHPLSVS
jgi:hypothetical protein